MRPTNHIKLFFVLIYVFSIPIWIAGSLLQKVAPDIRINLPLSAIQFIVPLIVALLLTYHQDGIKGVQELIKRVFYFRRIPSKIWYLPIFLLMPLVMLLAFMFIQVKGTPIPEPRIAIRVAPLLFLLFFITGSCEQSGWLGYAYSSLEKRWHSLYIAFGLGINWAVWHVIPYSQGDHAPAWIFWQCVYTVALQILIIWIYRKTTKSLFAAISLQAMSNVSAFLFPNYGSHYDPMAAAIAISLVIIPVIIYWN